MLRGVNMTLYPLAPSGRATTLDDVARQLDVLQEAGGNAVALVPHHYCFLRPGTPIITAPPWRHGQKEWIWEDDGETDNQRFPRTVSPDLVAQIVDECHKRALLTAIKPHVDPRTTDGYPGGWRGAISVKGEGYDHSEHWIRGHKRIAERYAGMLDGMDLLFLGAEYAQATRELGPEWVESVVRHLHLRKRQQEEAGDFTAMPALSYGANWGPCHDAEYVMLAGGETGWQLFDFMGISMYFPLCRIGQLPSPDLETIKAGWKRGAVDEEWCLPPQEQIRVSSGYGATRVVASEMGYRADEWAAHDNPGEEPRGALDEEMQVRCIRAARETWDGVLAGYFWWEFRVHPEAVADRRVHCLNLPDREEAMRWALSEDPWKVR
jgi:hypothetical protein